MEEIKQAIEKARNEIDNTGFKEMFKKEIGNDIDIEDTSEYFMFDDFDNLLHLLSLMVEKQREADHKYFRKKHGGHCNSGDAILETPLITEQLKTEKP